MVLSSLLKNSHAEFQNLRRLLKFSKLLVSHRNIMEKLTALVFFLHKHCKVLLHVIWGIEKEMICLEKINTFI